MRQAMLTATSSLRTALEPLDTRDLSDADCRWLIEQLAWVEKYAAAARVRVGTVLQDRGDRRTAEWMSRQTGQSAGRVRSELEERKKIEACQVTRSALDDGVISQVQAAEIAKTEADAPGNEADLLAFAQGHSLAGLRDEARKRRLARVDRDELHAQQHAAMSLRTWTNDLGMTCLQADLPPEIGVPIVTRIRRQTDRIFRHAYKQGRRDSNERYAAEAFVELINDSSAGRSTTKADVVVVVDLNAYRRGQVEDGEVCHIVGGGPIPVDIARAMSEDAFLKAVLHDGVNIHTIKHFGRKKPATLLTALSLGTPPAFDGLVCVDDDCDKRHGIELDHDNPVANGGPSSYANYKPRCKPSHREKTKRDRERGLLRKKPP